MNFSKNREIVDEEISAFSARVSAEIAKNYGDEIREIFAAYLAILGRGGKRNRAAMAMYSYEIFGGKSAEISRKIGLVQELFQAYLLVLDDIMDQSDLRRGGPSAHKILETNFREKSGFGNAEHFGISEAICAGMLGQNYAFSELLQMNNVENSAKISALNLANEMLIRTTFGQISDISGEAFREKNPEKILRTLREKTAFYSFLLPLEMGRIFAEKDENFSRKNPGEIRKNSDEKIAKLLEDFAKNAGLAFQLRDDVDGLFLGLGKPKKSDITEGKRTILVSFVEQNGDEKSRKVLRAALGNENLTDENFAKVLEIFSRKFAVKNPENFEEFGIKKSRKKPDEIREISARKYTENLAEKFAKNARENLDELNEIREFPDKLTPLYALAK